MAVSAMKRNEMGCAGGSGEAWEDKTSLDLGRKIAQVSWMGKGNQVKMLQRALGERLGNVRWSLWVPLV